MVNIYADIFRFKVKKINEKDLKEFSNKKIMKISSLYI